MSEYCHHCGTTISEDIATLCPLCASKPATLRREELLVADESNTANDNHHQPAPGRWGVHPLVLRFLEGEWMLEEEEEVSSAA